VVDIGLLFHRISDVAMNWVPVTVSVNAAPPSTALSGESDVIVGTGLGGGLTVKVSVAEVPPPGPGF